MDTKELANSLIDDLDKELLKEMGKERELLVNGIRSMGYTRLGLSDIFAKPIGWGLLLCKIINDTTIQISSRFKPNDDGNYIMTYAKKDVDLSEPTNDNGDVIGGIVDKDAYIMFVAKKIASAEIYCETERVMDKKGHSILHNVPLYMSNLDVILF